MVRKLAPTKQWVFRWEVIGRTGTKHVVGMHANGMWGCSCGKWVFHRKPKVDCHHIDEVKGKEPVDTAKTAPEAVVQFKQRVPQVTVPTPYFVLQTRREICLEED